MKLDAAELASVKVLVEGALGLVGDAQDIARHARDEWEIADLSALARVLQAKIADLCEKIAEAQQGG